MLKGVPAPQHNYQVHPPMSGGSDRGVYTLATQRNAMYIDNWRIDQGQLWHRHTNDLYESGGLEYAVSQERVCWGCEAVCSDLIWFAHRLQQLP